MTSLTQLITDSIPEVKPDVTYSLPPGCIDAILMLVCINQKTIPDFQEVVDMITKWGMLAPAEKIALTKRAAEIAKESRFDVGYRKRGIFLNIAAKDRETGRELFDMMTDEISGLLMIRMEDKVVILSKEDLPNFSPEGI